jgi:putative addiction module antidote
MNDRARPPEPEGYVLQVRKIGNSTGLILPKELLARLKLSEGDKLHVVEQTERGLS